MDRTLPYDEGLNVISVLVAGTPSSKYPEVPLAPDRGHESGNSVNAVNTRVIVIREVKTTCRINRQTRCYGIRGFAGRTAIPCTVDLVCATSTCSSNRVNVPGNGVCWQARE